ncbi:hypothetical protein FBT96_00405 [Rhodobacter capsulatus]|uniref:Uncharacterized protein n=1 Tax=Rhodobacter capsulatus TaxID=1061 RepID=A0A4U1K321_RHOCA|nr:hypothetical protein [Rhodobacter capsulatus]TKD26474.1 hypothetical protein FBT96_00405 [Rhodobacter capsulatus]
MHDAETTTTTTTTEADTASAPPVPQGAVRLAVLGGDPAVSQALRRGGALLADAEPGPKQASAALLAQFHYGLASARAGALGDVRLLAQLIAAAQGEAAPVFWPQPDGTLVDAARPEVDPAGLPDLATATAYRQAHLTALARLLAEAETLVLPLGAPTLLTDPASGQVFPRPPAGLHAPDWPEARMSAKDLDAGFARLSAGLQALNPTLRLCLIVLPAPPGARAETRASHALLAARAADWARGTARVRHDPVLDALVGRLLAQGGEAADPDPLAALVVRLCGGADLLDLLAGGAAPPPAAAATDRKQRAKDPERRARRKARAEAKGKTAKVMCEDELLEAFSK